MTGGWWVQQCQDSSFQEVKSVSSWFPWGRSTWELQLPAACIHKARGRPSPWHLTGRVWEREREIVHRRNKRRHVVHYFICTVQKDVSASAKEISWGYTGKHKDGWMSGRARHEERNGKWEPVKIKDRHSLYWKDQIWLIEDMGEMMKRGNEKKSEDTQGQRESRQN